MLQSIIDLLVTPISIKLEFSHQSLIISTWGQEPSPNKIRWISSNQRYHWVRHIIKDKIKMACFPRSYYFYSVKSKKTLNTLRRGLRVRRKKSKEIFKIFRNKFLFSLMILNYLFSHNWIKFIEISSTCTDPSKIQSLKWDNSGKIFFTRNPIST